MTSTTLILGSLGVLLSLPAWFLFIRAAWRIFRLISSGTASPGRFSRPWNRLGRVLVEVFAHPRMMKKPWIGAAHWAVMVGFLFGAVVWFEAYIQAFYPAGGWPLLHHWPPYHLAEEVLAVGTLLGIALLIGVRLRLGHTDKSSRFYGSNPTAARLVEAVVAFEALGMLLVKAAKIATYGGGSPWADFLSIHLAALLPASPVLVSAFALAKLLGGMVFLVAVALHLNWGVGWHRFLAFFTIFFRRERPLGPLQPVSLEDAEEEPVGVGTLPQAPWKMLLDATACTECGRCQELCPAWNTDKPLSPKLLMTSLRDVALDNEKYLRDPSLYQADSSEAGVDVLKLVGHNQAIHPDVLWSCTNCGACVEQCPVDIEHIDHIADMRRFQVLVDSEFPSELAGMFKNLEVKGNPWGRNSSERASWVEEARRDGIEVPVVGEDITDFSDTEYLFWVGCAGAFDDEGKKTTRAVVELLHTAGVKFAVLSTGESCTGDPARRAGNEFLFQMLATDTIATLNNTFEGVPQGQRKIITTCPHCFNTLRNEYPDFDGHYDVFHHTQLLNRLVREKRLTPVPRGPHNRKPITYHDPCFLGRHNKVFDPPRALLGATGMELREMDRNRNEAFCCGAGGARMFMEEKLGTRINEFRTQQALNTGAEEIAVGCPFCNTMMSGGVKALAEEPAQAPVVRDVARMLRDSVLVDGHLPAPRERAFLDAPVRTALPLTPKKLSTPPAPEQSKVPAPASPPPPMPSGAAVPTPGAAIPVPGSTPTPGGAVPAPVPPTPPVPQPGSAVPRPGAAVPPPGAVPAPGGAAPAAPQPPQPGGAVPKPSGAVPAPPQPGNAIPRPGNAVPKPGSAVPPPGTSAPAPGSAVPTPPQPGNAVPRPGGPVPKPGRAVPPPGAATPTPGSSVPTPPQPGNAVPRPGSAVPTPPQPGNAVPKPGGAVPPPPGT
ncbi:MULTISPECIES: heterodisulfide reductase-related iron-sulfur binding cluster [unclassified Corynebacterium]|uniref:heterodisulfide reductase-related iron-sulfur binding cluster n=1 Tax=unclassified Corynebacterium TaxID=2624378 RepID=UPI0029C9ED51|nr:MULTISPECIES: heterodisulfide reductase-related iron-sulfur binding cluster [unclassified Corynebacterium]WPF65975.1 heterodisulfide reductase-related iron-sulfur binding cluster [Corynebacterium sp. 22KM0430]WPF68468.1 heterodisulfide reductase-related iron-sulfur binding cluster [Corynebacterium sp. 21KM1197]